MKVKLLSSTDERYPDNYVGKIGTLSFGWKSATFLPHGTRMDDHAGFITSEIKNKTEEGRLLTINTRNSTYIFEKVL